MVSAANRNNTRPVWFVGATDDQTTRFLVEGIWENGDDNDLHLDLVKSVQSDDRIAIKSTAVQQRYDLPFDSRGNRVSTMWIKATGLVMENPGDGRHLKVDWASVDQLREWYFYTCPRKVWKVLPGDWRTDGLIDFTFNNKPQDIDRFRNSSYWRKRFGDEGAESLPNELASVPLPPPSYTIADIISDGCFLERSQLETMLQRLADKRNIILQGPPGTGKTWLAKRLAYALVGSKDDDCVRPLQFHPNMSYEDFVRGWRPAGEGRLELVDGPFLRLIDDARQNPDARYVTVIEEINRGNPAQIFGEMLTLLEADKRHPGEAMALAYPRDAAERIHIPPNVYLIGTMNVADRSLALVDFALRRRFAFFDLEPTFGSVWRNWVSNHTGISGDFLRDVERRLTALNNQIAADPALGPQFRIGHSVVTPPPDAPIDNPPEWFRQAVATEIAPLLREYWFDDPAKADNAQSTLLAGLP